MRFSDNTQFRNFCFTRFFDSEEDAIASAEHLDGYFDNDIFQYIVVNVEACPETDRIHWQGYCELTTVCKWGRIKNTATILVGAHVENRKGTQQEAIDYCVKERTRVAGPYFYGEPKGKRGAGKVTAQTIVDYIKANPLSTMDDIEEEFTAYCMMHYDKVQSCLLRHKRVKFEDKSFVARAWQEWVLQRLRAPADDRTIFWVTDAAGAMGKSRLAKHLVAEHKAVQLGGRHADMALIYRNSLAPVVIFDVSRSERDFSQDVYSMAENLKNGTVISSKYQSESLQFNPPHVIVFSNRSWDRSMWTVNRVVEFDLGEEKWHVLPEVPEEAGPSGTVQPVEDPIPPPPTEADIEDIDFDIDAWFRDNYGIDEVAAQQAARFL